MSEQTIQLTPDQKAAIIDARDLLRTEGNQLADFLRKGIKATLSLRLDELQSPLPDVIPHRVTIAIHKEMERVRKVASVLNSLLPKEAASDEQ
jgi:hypothetical protein